MTMFTFARCARGDELKELADGISPLELVGVPEERVRSMRGWLHALAATCRTYVVRTGGMLAGICFVKDLEGPPRRMVAFVKTERFTARRTEAARSVPEQFRCLARLERESGRAGTPMYFSVPFEDVSARGWYVRMGCTAAEGTLLRFPEWVEQGKEVRDV